MTPLEKTEAFFTELTRWYGEGDERELRAAAKLLMVSLDKLSQHGGPHWQATVYEYVNILANDPEHFRRMLESQRGETRDRDGTTTH